MKIPVEGGIVWVDLEMTGLDLNTDRIVEIAVIVTDKNLNIIQEGPNLIIHQPDDLLEGMNDFVKNLHTTSGLLDKIKTSTITTEQAQEEVCTFLSQFEFDSKPVLGGNSVHMDKMFLQKEMPQLLSYLHYRIVDVSTIKEVFYRWYKGEPPKKKNTHRALDDIIESIEELKWYRENIFVEQYPTQ